MSVIRRDGSATVRGKHVPRAGERSAMKRTATDAPRDVWPRDRDGRQCPGGHDPDHRRLPSGRRIRCHRPPSGRSDEDLSRHARDRREQAGGRRNGCGRAAEELRPGRQDPDDLADRGDGLRPAHACEAEVRPAQGLRTRLARGQFRDGDRRWPGVAREDAARVLLRGREPIRQGRRTACRSPAARRISSA